MKIGRFTIRERRAPLPKSWERGYEDYTRDPITEWQAIEGRKIVFRADTFQQAQKWAKENM